MKCQICQSEIEDNALFCPHCGAKVASDPTAQGAPSSSVNSLGMGYAPFPIKFHSTYIFVVSLILMILGALAWIIGISSASSVSNFIQEYYSAMTQTQRDLFNELLAYVRGENWFMFFSFGSTLVLMIFSIGLKSKTKENYRIEIVTKQAKQQFIMAIVALVIASAFVIFEIVAINRVMEITTLLGVDAIADMTSLIFPIAKVGLLIPCIFMAQSSIKKVKESYKPVLKTYIF